MLEPGTTLVGEARNRSSVGPSQVRFDLRSASVYVNCELLAAGAPKIPVSAGPCAPPSSPCSAVWQSAHCARNTVLPAFASAPKAGAAHARTRTLTTSSRVIQTPSATAACDRPPHSANSHADNRRCRTCEPCSGQGVSGAVPPRSGAFLDLLDELRQPSAGASLDEARRAHLDEALDAAGPLHGLRDLSYEQRADARLRVIRRIRFGRDVRNDREARRGKAKARQEALELLGRWLHVPRMERAAHLQRNDHACACAFQNVIRALYVGGWPGNDGLRGRVVVRDIDGGEAVPLQGLLNALG